MWVSNRYSKILAVYHKGFGSQFRSADTQSEAALHYQAQHSMYHLVEAKLEWDRCVEKCDTMCLKVESFHENCSQLSNPFGSTFAPNSLSGMSSSWIRFFFLTYCTRIKLEI